MRDGFTQQSVVHMTGAPARGLKRAGCARRAMLRGYGAQLETLRPDHAPALAEVVAGDTSMWRWMTAAPCDERSMRAWVEARRSMVADGRGWTFAICDTRQLGGARLAGATSLFDLDVAGRRAEVGHTWLAAPWRGSGLNAVAKRLILGWAFDGVGLARVQLMTDARNERSQRAMASIGAVREGLLRNYRFDKTGALRDSVVFSITAAEWPDVARRLDERALVFSHTTP